MCVYIDICTHTDIHAYVRTYIYNIYICIYIYICTCIYMCIYIYHISFTKVLTWSVLRTAGRMAAAKMGSASGEEFFAAPFRHPKVVFFNGSFEIADGFLRIFHGISGIVRDLIGFHGGFGDIRMISL